MAECAPPHRKEPGHLARLLQKIGKETEIKGAESKAFQKAIGSAFFYSKQKYLPQKDTRREKRVQEKEDHKNPCFRV